MSTRHLQRKQGHIKHFIFFFLKKYPYICSSMRQMEAPFETDPLQTLKKIAILPCDQLFTL